MSAVWHYARATNEFSARLRKCVDDAEAALVKTRSRQAADRWDAIDAFLAAVGSVHGCADPLAKLSPVEENGQRVANYYALRVGSFVAYYRVDIQQYQCTACWVHLDTDEPMREVAKMLAARNADQGTAK